MLLLANVLQPLIDASEEVLKFFHDQIGFGWGASIIGLTVVVRLLILPLTFKQVRSMQELQRLQPEIKKIQERYKEDRQRMNQEMMRFYQEHKVNPLGSCLPLLLQFPFFIALFYMLREDLRVDICGQTAKPCGDVAGAHESGFLFIPDVTDKATGAVLVFLIVVYIVTQLASLLVSTATADKNQRRLMLALPFVFVLFIINFESGLIVYWITTNIWTIGQQMFVKRFLPPPAPLPAGAAAATDGKGAKAKPRTAARAGSARATGDDGTARRPPPSPRKKKKRSGRRR
jgi:YidC/Oxa1 family membrane protein insertase